jgi:hypothetical protein
MMQREFDSEFYLHANPDVQRSGMDPFDHFLKYGWRENRDPTPDFSMASYAARYADVRKSGENPFSHYLRVGRRKGRLGMTHAERSDEQTRQRVFHLAQDLTFPLAAENAKRIMVIVVPEHNEMSGGIYSFFSIAKAAYKLRRTHGYFVLLMTRPNSLDETYLRQRHFRNSEDVFRFEQVRRCREAEEVYILIPEYATPNFVGNINSGLAAYLRSRNRLHINILNQKQDIMPEREEFSDLFSLTPNVTMSVAHHGYFGQAFADRYGLPMLLLPAYTDLSEYEASDFIEKEPLIIYSPDQSDYKKDVLSIIATELPEYQLQEIRGHSFDQYMDLATRCRFSITFGEGFDGYLAQPIYQGGIGFAVYNDEFYPSAELLECVNIFEDASSMLQNIVPRLKLLESDPTLYRQTNQRMMDVYNRLYSRQDYLLRAEKLFRREFDLFPNPSRASSGHIRL